MAYFTLESMSDSKTEFVNHMAAQVRFAAVSDLHIRCPDDVQLFPELGDLRAYADLLVVAGDITESGRIVEAEAAAEWLATANLPVVAVLGNHDLRSLRRMAFRRSLEKVGVEVLDGSTTRISLDCGLCVGVAGTTGCGGGFWPVEGPNAIQNRSLKRLAVRARNEFASLDRALQSLDADVRIAVTHFAPTTTTLGREPIAKYWMLGNCELGAVMDGHRPDLIVHGHAHLGNRWGTTPGGVPVRNVAWPVVRAVHTELLGVHAHVG